MRAAKLRRQSEVPAKPEITVQRRHNSVEVVEVYGGTILTLENREPNENLCFKR